MYKIISPSGEILALKRVKMAGLDSATIEGLRNEVSLLEKLAGDDRIIRLWDWEEIAGESLLMVLEYGEIDLANLMSKQNTPNFIRMYWEQVYVSPTYTLAPDASRRPFDSHSRYSAL